MDFLEEANVVRCSFCGSSLYVAGRQGVLRYVMPAPMVEASRASARAVDFLRKSGRRNARAVETVLFHVPFWRIQGFAFRWVFGQRPMTSEGWTSAPPPMERVKELLYRTFDHTVPGFSGVDLGLPSMGVRPQVLELQPLGRSHGGSTLLPLDVPLDQVKAATQELSRDLPVPEEIRPEVVIHRLVGVKFSVIYVPFWYVQCRDQGGTHAVLVDAAGGDVARSIPHAVGVLPQLLAGHRGPPSPVTEIRFLPFRCPNCGWGFPFHRLSFLHLCRTCHRLWSERRGEWCEIPYAVVPPPQGRPWDGPVWIPFWRFRAAVESQGTRLDTVAELRRVAPPIHPLPADPKAGGGPIHFYIPAVRLRNPKTLHNLASRLTFAQPGMAPGAFPQGLSPRSLGGSLSQADASELGPMILGALIPPMNRRAVELLNGCRVELSEPMIIYFPFEQANLYWEEPWTRLAFQRSALSEESLDGVSE